MNEVSNVKTALQIQSWAAMVEECQNSGLSARTWCDQHGLNVKTYYYRLRKVREASLGHLPKEIRNSLSVSQKETVSFKKLDITPPVSGMQAAVIVHLNDVDIEISNDATRETVEAVLLALKSVC